jgi:hypothetical protein
MRVIRTFIVSVALVLTAAAASAQDRALPDFLVRHPDGHEVASAVMSAQPKWLLVYLTPDCRPCNTFLRALPKWQSPGLAVRLVLVIAGPRTEAKAWLDKVLPADMEAPTWYADPERAAAKALELTGAPVLVGVRNGILEWELGGVLNDPAALESVVRSWVEDRK